MDNTYDEEFDDDLEGLSDEYKALDEQIQCLRDLKIHTPVLTFIVDAMLEMVAEDIGSVTDINNHYKVACLLTVASDFIHPDDKSEMLDIAEYTRNLCAQCFVSMEMEMPLHYHITIQ